MKAVISADELAKDVAGAEALLESHQEHRVSRWQFISLERKSCCPVIFLKKFTLVVCILCVLG